MGKLALGAGALLGALGLASSQAIAFESAMADVGKVVNFESQAEMEAMGDTIRDMAGRIPMAADGIAAIIAAAGQSGVAKQDLTEFAEQAAKMGVAFDLSGAEAGKMMSDWRAGMNLTLPQVYSLADAVNHLSNNMNATAPALGEVIPARGRGGYGQRPWGKAGGGARRGLPFRRGKPGNRGHGAQELYYYTGQGCGHVQGSGRRLCLHRHVRHADGKGHARRTRRARFSGCCRP